MNILGIHYGHNATVCLMQQGRIVFCQSEERFLRIKNVVGFPGATLNYVYRHLVSPEQIDRAVLFQKSVAGYRALRGFGFKPVAGGHYLEPEKVKVRFKDYFYDTYLGGAYRRRRELARESNAALRREMHDYFGRALRLPPEKVDYIDHHLAHAYSAIPNTLDWGRTLIFTLDGQGDGKCATVNLSDQGHITVLASTDLRHSLGYYYEATTAIMGMKAGEHEFKVMGMAPYAKRQYYEKLLAGLARMLRVDDRGRWHSTVRANSARLVLELEELYRFQRFDNIAGAIQELTETLVLKWVEFWVKNTGCRNVALAGGVFMNVKACQKVGELECVERLFVVPSAGDETTPLGAVVWAHLQHRPAASVEPLRDLYLGVEYNDAEIEKALAETAAQKRYTLTRPDNINRAIAELLARNIVVARCSGRMEFGARALGNRSILANPSEIRNLQLINDAIKSRDFWMPFTPSILEEDMPRYIERHEKIFAPYMCITFNSTPAARRDLAAAIHPKDYTVRPQCVKRDWNPDYHEIISVFKHLTGIAGVLNTSFNLHGEPNVCSPQDAIRTVDDSGLTHLALGGFLLTKRV